MMKLTGALSIVAVLLGGCNGLNLGLRRSRVKPTGAPKPPVVMNSPSIKNSVRDDSMILTIDMPKRRFAVGENIELGITATSTSDKAIPFVSPSSALYRVTIYRMTSAGWRWVNQYPQAVMKVRKTWTLLPSQSVKYNQVIPVMRDWPMDEQLKMVVELEGRPALKCPMYISATVKR